MHLLIMGPPGAGKGTQATSIAEAISGVHISTGDIFRENVARGTDLGRAAQAFIDAGEYVPDDVTNAMVRARLAEPDALEAFVLDGFPRTLAQVDELDVILEDLGVDLDAVISLQVEEDEVVARLTSRAARSGRSDDAEDVIRHRQVVYREQTAPLLDVYADRGLLRAVDGQGEEGAVLDRVLRGIGARTGG